MESVHFQIVGDTADKKENNTAGGERQPRLISSESVQKPHTYADPWKAIGINPFSALPY